MRVEGRPDMAIFCGGKGDLLGFPDYVHRLL